MAEQQQVIERSEDGTVIRTGADGQRLKIPQLLPILPIRNIVVFPGTVMPLNIGRAKSNALLASVRAQANRVIELSPNTPDEASQVLNSITSPSALADFLAANLQTDVAEKQGMLEELDVEKRLRMVASRLATQLDILELQNKIQRQVTENIDKSQRRVYLQGQLKAIRKELGRSDK